MNAVICAVLLAVSSEPEVDRAEVLRNGNMVQVVGGWQGDFEHVGVEALSPPASDADKWFVSVITTAKCPPCERLKAAWKSGDEYLSALAVYDDPEHSYAHLNFYDASDRSQKFRFENLKLQGYPTIVVQPPRSGKYGDPSTVVCQIAGFDGNSKLLVQNIVSSMKKYASRLASRTAGASTVKDGAYQSQDEDIGINPPWDPTPQPMSDPAFPSLDRVVQTVPPTTSPILLSYWPWYAHVFTGFALALGIVWGVPKLLEHRSKISAKQQELDAAMSQMLKYIQTQTADKRPD